MMSSLILILFIFRISFVHGNDDEGGGTEAASENAWKNTAISSLFLLVIIISVLAYIISINKRLKRRLRTLEQMCIDHGITKHRPYPYLSSDDEYDELNPFLTKSDLDNDRLKENLIELGANSNDNGNINNKQNNFKDNDHDEYDDIDRNKGYQQENVTIY